jgi:hypothetical protein
MGDRVFDDPGRLAQLIGASIITHRIQVDTIEVQVGEETEEGPPRAGAGMALYLDGRPNHVHEGHYERVHVIGLDVAAKLAGAVIVVGTNTWGEQFSGPLDAMLKDPRTMPEIATPGKSIILPGTWRPGR